MGVFHPTFPKMADRQRGAGLSPLAALVREISKTCKPFRPTQTTQYIKYIRNKNCSTLVHDRMEWMYNAGSLPMSMVCPACKANVMTDIKKTYSKQGYIASCICCVLW